MGMPLGGYRGLGTLERYRLSLPLRLCAQSLLQPQDLPGELLSEELRQELEQLPQVSPQEAYLAFPSGPQRRPVCEWALREEALMSLRGAGGLIEGWTASPEHLLDAYLIEAYGKLWDGVSYPQDTSELLEIFVESAQRLAEAVEPLLTPEVAECHLRACALWAAVEAFQEHLGAWLPTSATAEALEAWQAERLTSEQLRRILR